MILPIGSLALVALIFLVAYAGRNQYKDRHLKKEWKRNRKHQRLMQQ
ncbi:MAG: hypothetical protein H7Y86_02065 [Rhizobacter sp.]|nr:hypothetical protein [Ferruginibacter sp.]